MSKAKKIKCRIYRNRGVGHLTGDNWATPFFCWDDFRRLCPGLIKGLRPGRSRKLILTQTKNGIKLERAEK